MDAFLATFEDEEEDMGDGGDLPGGEIDLESPDGADQL